jgi:hypothetical protein
MQPGGNEAGDSQQVDALKNISTPRKGLESSQNELPRTATRNSLNRSGAEGAGSRPGAGAELKGANFMHCSYIFDCNYISIHVPNISETPNTFPLLPSKRPSWRKARPGRGTPAGRPTFFTTLSLSGAWSKSVSKASRSARTCKRPVEKGYGWAAMCCLVPRWPGDKPVLTPGEVWSQCTGRPPPPNSHHG